MSLCILSASSWSLSVIKTAQNPVLMSTMVTDLTLSLLLACSVAAHGNDSSQCPGVWWIIVETSVPVPGLRDTRQPLQKLDLTMTGDKETKVNQQRAGVSPLSGLKQANRT